MLTDLQRITMETSLQRFERAAVELPVLDCWLIFGDKENSDLVENACQHTDRYEYDRSSITGDFSISAGFTTTGQWNRDGFRTLIGVVRSAGDAVRAVGWGDEKWPLQRRWGDGFYDWLTFLADRQFQDGQLNLWIPIRGPQKNVSMNWELMQLGTYPSDQLEEYGVDADRFKSWIGNPPNFLEFNLCDVVTLSIAVCSMLLNEVTARPTRMTTEPTGDAQSTPNEDETDATRTVVDPEPFESGRIVFFEDRVELCGVDICSGRRSTRKRQVLDLLKLQTGHQFIAYSGSKLAAEMSLDSSNSVAAVIRDLRKRITELLRKQANLLCGNKDVILSGGLGYRFSEKLTVQLGSRTDDHRENPDKDDGHVGNVGDFPVGSVGDDGKSSVGNVGDQATSTVASRRQQIITLLADRSEISAKEIAQRFGCSIRSGERDLKALKEQGLVEAANAKQDGRFRKQANNELDD